MQMCLDERGHELAGATFQPYFLNPYYHVNIVDDWMDVSEAVLDRTMTSDQNAKNFDSDNNIFLTTDDGGVTNPQN
jgi:hypothetical protein